MGIGLALAFGLGLNLDLDLDLSFDLDSVFGDAGDLPWMGVTDGMGGSTSSSPSRPDDLVGRDDSGLVGEDWLRSEDISMVRYRYESW